MEVSSRLNDSPYALMQNAVERFSSLKEKATGAYMLNENRISVEYARGEKQFAGTISEMVEIQSALSGMGIKVDKLGRLDWTGKITVEVARELKRPLPASLQD